MNLVNGHKTAGLSDLLRMYCVAGQTARLTVNYPDGDGVFFFEKGDLIEAQLGHLSGAEAVQQALRGQQEGFRVDLDVAVPPRAIFGAMTGWLTEAPQPDHDSAIKALTTAVENEALASTTSDQQDDQQKNYEQRKSASRDDETAQLEDAAPLTINRQIAADITEPRMAEGELTDSGNQIMGTTVVPTLAEYEEKADEQSSLQILAATGIVQSGIVIDEDGVMMGEIGASDPALAQTAFMVAGLEALVSAQFEMGQCEGALLDKAGAAMLVTKAGGLSCAFIPVPRVPIARAFTETRRALEQLAGERQ